MGSVKETKDIPQGGVSPVFVGQLLNSEKEDHLTIPNCFPSNFSNISYKVEGTKMISSTLCNQAGVISP